MHEPAHHPLVKLMESEFAAMEAKDSTSIKAVRNQVLSYIEPQYKLIIVASAALVAFIKRQQESGGIFAIKDRMSKANPLYGSFATEGLRLLNDYASSFHRDASLWVKARVKIQQWLFAPYMGICHSCWKSPTPLRAICWSFHKYSYTRSWK